MRCRKNVKDLSQGERDAFIQAIEGLKGQNSVLHPGAQSRYDDFVEIHRSAMDAAVIAAGGTVTNPGWGHFDSAFFPWHRELLYRFEEELRAIRPGVTIPYWDWTRGQSAASAAWPFFHEFIGVDGTDANADRVMREPGAPSPYPYEFDPETWTVVVTDNPGDPVVLRRAFAERADAPGLPTNDVDVTGTGTNFREAIASASYLTLRARSEDLHNLVHRWANGSMITASSPNDPVFWMHHAQHDRMWTMWQERNPALAPYVHVNGFAGHGLNDTLVFHEPGDPAPWAGTATPADLLDAHAMHATSIWYASDLPEITPPGGSLSFGAVPEGLTQYRAVRFDLRTCRQVRFRVTGPPSGNFGLTPLGSQFIVEPDLAADAVTGLVWLEFTATGGSPQSSSVTIEAYILDAEGYYAATEGGEHVLGTYTVDLFAAVVAREDNAVVLVLDRSGSMGAAAGGGSTRSSLMKNAVEVFHALLRPNDEIGIVSFDDVADSVLALTTQSAGLGTTLTGTGLDPRGNTGIGLGIQAGAAMLAGASHANRSLLVLTDGNQNVHPYVEELPAGTVTSRTHAIGFGLPGDVSDATLHAITSNTQGDLIITGVLATADEQYLLTKHFVQVLAAVTNANVVLDPESELLLGSEHVTPFAVAKADVSIDVMALAPTAPFLELVLRTPDGTEIDPAAAAAEPNVDFRIEPRVTFYRIELPALRANPGGSHAGTWSIVVRARKAEELKRMLGDRKLDVDVEEIRRALAHRSIPYSCVVHARSNLDFAASIEQESMRPGSDATIFASLSEYGVAFDGSARVWAEVTAPDGAASTIVLDQSGDGRFAASLPTKVPGVYRVRVRAEGATSSGSTFTREKTLTASTFMHRPGRGAPGDGDGDRTGLADLLACLVESVQDPGPLRKLGIDVERLRACVERSRERDGRRATEPSPPGVPTFERRLRPIVDLAEELHRLVERRVDAVAEWPDEGSRRKNAEERAKLRREMAKHPDPGLMMFPPFDDEGRAVLPKLDHEHDHGDHERGDHEGGEPGHGEPGGPSASPR